MKELLEKIKINWKTETKLQCKSCKGKINRNESTTDTESTTGKSCKGNLKEMGI